MTSKIRAGSKSKYSEPFVATDVVLFSFQGGVIKVLLIQRGRPPFKGRWAMPGGFIELRETLLASARRELREETGLSRVALEPFTVMGDPGRDPRGRTITIAYFGVVRPEQTRVRGGDDARLARWFPIDRLPRLAFDHDALFEKGLDHLREYLRSPRAALGMLPARRFSAGEMRRLYGSAYAREIPSQKFLDWLAPAFSRKLTDGQVIGRVGPRSLRLLGGLDFLHDFHQDSLRR